MEGMAGTVHKADTVDTVDKADTEADKEADKEGAEGIRPTRELPLPPHTHVPEE